MGCTVKSISLEERQNKIVVLKNILLHLGSKVDNNEAEDLARSSINYSFVLAQKYHALPSPWIQNTLVNIGLKERGLCHQWAEDLLAFLRHKHYKVFSFHAIGANVGDLDEHNALSVSLKGQGIKNSVILDAWRNSGNLYFSKIESDKKYQWKERFSLYKNLSPKR